MAFAVHPLFSIVYSAAATIVHFPISYGLTCDCWTVFLYFFELFFISASILILRPLDDIIATLGRDELTATKAELVVLKEKLARKDLVHKQRINAMKRRIECLENVVTRCTNELTESRTNLLEVRDDVARLQQEVELGAGREGVVAQYREELEDARGNVERLVQEIAHGVAREEVCFRFTKKDKLEFFLFSGRGGIIAGLAAKPNWPLLVHFVSRALQISHQKTLCPRVRAHFLPAMSRNDMSNGQRHGRGTSEDETCNPTETNVVPHVSSVNL
ncbi:hypothetical protein CAEBREN_14547 [Caenorhabditis brenneri]|uniref:Uncharacterized protein n=1 Tax=Caenorhabditis brenneri TaxID=135651 RepID=G0NXD4_CAEBE|nr:hypothetical protein CAEBREN_14547 [Caenorhabditis brenneri]